MFVLHTRYLIAKLLYYGVLASYPVQDLRAHMEAQYEEISRWKKWSLENTCDLLKGKFPGSAIWIVRPSRTLRYLFSCFQHFVDSSLTGVPEHDATHGAIPHLEHLLRDAVHQVHLNEGVAGKEVGWSMSTILSLPLVLVGFSKGCVVLNQIIHELGNYVKEEGVDSHNRKSPIPGAEIVHKLDHKQVQRGRDFVKRIKAFYWLDAGHSGTHDTWVTSDELLKTLSSLGAEIHIHVTPQQVCDPHRPWLGEEQRLFVSKLQQLGANVRETIHFEHDERSLEKHFRVLEVFS